MHGDGSAVGVPDDMRSLHAQVKEESQGGLRLFCDAERHRREIAPAVSGAPVPDDTILLDEDGLAAQWQEGIGDDASMDKENRFATTLLLVL